MTAGGLQLGTCSSKNIHLSGKGHACSANSRTCVGFPVSCGLLWGLAAYF